jgi:RNA-directed DNA polymerase
VEERQIPRSTQDHPQAALRQIESAEGGASKTQTSVRGGAREMVEVCSTGYFNYHAVPGNLASLRSFRLQVIRCWLRALQRRSQKDRMTWPRLVAIAARWLPKPSILHPYPNLRFDATHPR